MAGDAVIYLCRKGDPAVAHTAFFKSLAANPFGMAADLIVILKGFEPNETPQELRAYRNAACQTVHEIRMPDEGRWVINAFRDAAMQLPHERVLFFTSHSRMLAPNWLALYARAYDRMENCGVVTATGSFEAAAGMAFPNVAIRTNAFMVERRIFLQSEFGELDTKRANYVFEAGPNNFTRQLMAKGLIPVVVDCEGQSWKIEDWPRSLTFRSGRQQRLLIADNRTHIYDVASNGSRVRLAELAFGDKAHVTSVSTVDRLKSAWSWRWP